MLASFSSPEMKAIGLITGRMHDSNTGREWAVVHAPLTQPDLGLHRDAAAGRRSAELQALAAVCTVVQFHTLPVPRHAPPATMISSKTDIDNGWRPP